MSLIEYEDLRKSNLVFFDAINEKLKSTIDSGWYILGNNVEHFETDFAQYNNSLFCVGVASGLDALILSLKASNLPQDSEVLVPSNTYIATILSIIHAGFKPVLVEPYIDTYNISPVEVKKYITKKTRAILVVHLYGKLCQMDEILKLTNEYNLVLIEDCAQSHGARFRNQKSGTFGRFGAFSFYPTKNLGAMGDGGAILCNSESDASYLRSLRNYGSRQKYVNEHIGYNSRLDEIQAALLRIKLSFLDEITEKKRRLAKLYLNGLKEDFIKPLVNKDFYDVYHIFNIRHPRRNKIKEYLLNNNIKTEIHYPIPPHKQNALVGYFEDNYPISEEIHNTILSLPISFGHTEDEVCRVIEVLNKF